MRPKQPCVGLLRYSDPVALPPQNSILRLMSSSAHPAGDSPEKPVPSPVTREPNRRQGLERRLKDARTDREAYFELAAIYRGEGRSMQAGKILKQGCEVFPDDLDLLWEYEEAQLARSIEQLTEVREMAAKAKNAAFDQDLDRCATDWANCRVKVCRARLKRDPSLQNFRLVLGEALYDLDRPADAIDELEPLLDNDTHSSAAAYWIGKCHLVLGSDLESMHWFRIASLRRSVTSPPKVRVAALRMLIDLADRHGVAATLELYKSTLASIMESAKHHHT